MQWGRRKRGMLAEHLEERRCLTAYGFAEHLVVDSIEVDRNSILADLDADGDEDLVVDGKWRENVDGAFGPTHRYGTPRDNHYAIESGDLDGDGDLDLVAVGTFDLGYQVEASSELVWYENRDGEGRFGPRQTIVVFENGHGSPTLLLGNVDLDEADELFVLNSRAPADSIRRFDYDGAGTIIEVEASFQVARSGIARLLDVDGDGDADLVRGKEWLENHDGVGGFVNRGSYYDPALLHLTPIELADFNDDGWPDLAISSRANLTFLIGTPLWGNFDIGPIIETTDRAHFFTAAIQDFNRDGAFDVAAIMASDDVHPLYDVRFYPQVDGNFNRPTTLLPPKLGGKNVMLSTDINNDGHADLIYHRMTQLYSSVGNQFAAAQSLDPISDDSFLETDDVDRDGDVDLITYTYLSTCLLDYSDDCELSFYWRENLDGEGEYSREPHLINSPRVLGQVTFTGVTDVDGDGDQDVVYEFEIDGRYLTYWLERTDDQPHFSDAAVLGRYNSPLERMSDLDGDGTTDLIRRSATKLLVDWGGDRTHRILPIASFDSTISDVVFVDWDEDGDLDIVARRNARMEDLEIVVFRNEEREFAAAELVLENRERKFSRLGKLFVVDLIGDASNEIVFSDRGSGVLLFSREGDANWDSSILAENGTSLLTFADIDQDGRLDLLNLTSDRLHYIGFNQGGGLFRTQAIGRTSAYTSRTADVDGDGDLDLIYSGTMWSETRVIGDANGDGVFDSADLVVVMQAGVYEDDVPLNAVFQQGDWNGDGEFTSADLVYAFQLGIASAG